MGGRRRVGKATRLRGREWEVEGIGRHDVVDLGGSGGSHDVAGEGVVGLFVPPVKRDVTNLGLIAHAHQRLVVAALRVRPLVNRVPTGVAIVLQKWELIENLRRSERFPPLDDCEQQ